MIDVMKMLKARMYMKRNEPFLYSWHAYVGYELDLFKAFSRPFTICDVADALKLDEELLEQWVRVGVSIGHLKQVKKERFQVKNSWKLPKPKGQSSSGVLLKEMMELHIPTLLSYPEMLRNGSRNHFNEEDHANTVAETSRLLEVIAIGKIAKRIKEKKGGKVLDLGCGEAGYIRKLAERFPETYFQGVEISPSVVETAKKETAHLTNVQITQGDLWSYQPEGEQDLILLNNILHYIPLADRSLLIGRLSGWLEEGGILSIATPIAGHEDSPPFVNAFNSFFSSFDNLYRLPEREELQAWGYAAGLTFLGFQTVIKEGSWYVVQYKK